MATQKVNIRGVCFENPVFAASGSYGFGREYNEFYALSDVGAICTKGLTLLPRGGNAAPRIAETPCGMLNSVGLQNPGVEYFITEELPFLRCSGTKIIANIAGSSMEDYQAIATRLDGLVDMLELNISCPNVKHGGVAFGVQPASVRSITAAVKECCKVTPLMVKLSPNVSCIADNAIAAEEGGADAISLINTLTAMAVDLKTRRPLLANVTGGLSGPAVKPVALRMVYEAVRAVSVPVVALGGIATAEDALEFLLVGARAVQVGTANFTNPMAIPQIVRGISDYLDRQGIADVNDFIGTLKV